MSILPWRRKSCCYGTTLAQATAYALASQPLVGTSPDEGRTTITRIEASPYPPKGGQWGVCRFWRYTKHPSLGEFGGAYDYLP